MALAFTHQGRLWIVLDEENIDRIQRFDPFDLDGRSCPGRQRRRPGGAGAVSYQPGQFDEGQPRGQRLAPDARRGRAGLSRRLRW